MQNVGLDELQTRIKIAGGNANNLRYADDTTLMAESEEELKSLLIRVKEKSEKAGLKFHIQKTKIITFDPITSWQIECEKAAAVTDFLSLGFRITADTDCSLEIQRHLLLGRKAMTNLGSVLKAETSLYEIGPYSQSYGFSSGLYRCESQTIKKAECCRIDAFELWYSRRLL